MCYQWCGGRVRAAQMLDVALFHFSEALMVVFGGDNGALQRLAVGA
jgi:hypothetical protein